MSQPYLWKGRPVVSKSLRFGPQTAPDGRPPALTEALMLMAGSRFAAQGAVSKVADWGRGFIVKTGFADA